ncbi:MATE family efflux transporter [Lapidilactobacillus mulanensis]|uniref:Probable multidrug resistance protein NorM n=1 Tax=Lapidilactobacillus mulanensis TaxID=2485999 RepID=A0ABW4DQ22_9LACO|nr:MATE family efflux transporter [Lapidilactobacillus mulanensis]
MLTVKKLMTRYLSGESFDYRFVLSLLGPVIFDQFFLVAFNFINTAMISSSGEAAISAVNMVGSINVFLIQIFVAVGLGGTVLIAQYFGRKEYQMLGKVVNGTVFGAILVATSLALLFLLGHNLILNLLFGDAEKAVMDNARLYMVGVLISYPFEATVEGVNGSLRGIGRTKNSLQLSLVMNLLNLLFNFVFIIYFKMGVLGLVVSLNLSRWLASAFAGVTLFRHRDLFSLKWSSMKQPDFRMIKRVVTVCIPFAAESFFFNGGKIIMQMMIVSLGTQVIATNAIASSWVQLSEIVPTALGTALVPIVGQCIGRKNIKDARKITKSFVSLGILAYVIGEIILFLSFNKGIALFHPSDVIKPRIFELYLIFAVGHLLVWCISFTLPSALRAAGDAKFTTMVSLITMWGIRVGIGYLVGIVFGYGLPGIYFVWVCEWAVRGTIFLLRFRGKRWYVHRLI